MADPFYLLLVVNIDVTSGEVLTIDEGNQAVENILDNYCQCLIFKTKRIAAVKCFQM